MNKHVFEDSLLNILPSNIFVIQVVYSGFQVKSYSKSLRLNKQLGFTVSDKTFLALTGMRLQNSLEKSKIKDENYIYFLHISF